jgi:hypothetical protein
MTETVAPLSAVHFLILCLAVLDLIRSLISKVYVRGDCGRKCFRFARRRFFVKESSLLKYVMSGSHEAQCSSQVVATSRQRFAQMERADFCISHIMLFKTWMYACV